MNAAYLLCPSPCVWYSWRLPCRFLLFYCSLHCKYPQSCHRMPQLSTFQPLKHISTNTKYCQKISVLFVLNTIKFWYLATCNFEVFDISMLIYTYSLTNWFSYHIISMKHKTMASLHFQTIKTICWNFKHLWYSENDKA